MGSQTKPQLQTRRYMVRGRVQGVGFRWFVEREAHILGINGWVRNTFDGSVEMLRTTSPLVTNSPFEIFARASSSLNTVSLSALPE